MVLVLLLSYLKIRKGTMICWVIVKLVYCIQSLFHFPRNYFDSKRKIGLREDETVYFVYSFRCAPVAFTPSASLQSPPLVSYFSLARNVVGECCDLNKKSVNGVCDFTKKV